MPSYNKQALRCLAVHLIHLCKSSNVFTKGTTRNKLQHWEWCCSSVVAHEEFSKAFCSKLFAGEYGRLFLNVLVKFSPLCSNEIMAREHSYVVREKKKKTTYDFTDFLCNYLQETILFRLQPALFYQRSPYYWVLPNIRVNQRLI